MARAPLRLGLLLSILGLFAFTSIGYAEEGIATWYGEPFHGRRMAGGGVYDMYDPTTTAANRWPFGTWLRVTNPANGKSVTVQVRDRGGFSHALDLSYAAFLILDNPKKMQIRVNYEVVDGPDAPAATSDAAPKPAPPAASKPAPKPAPAPPASPAAPRVDQGKQPAQSQQSATPEDYLVMPGDTLLRIASKFGIDVKALIALNGIDDADRIAPGQRLRLKDVPRPVEAPRGGRDTEGVREASSNVHYTVQPGDTLSGIASRFGLDAAALAALNDLRNPELIAVGLQLRLSQGSAAQSAAAAPAAQAASHTVATGDTLGSIALQYGVSEAALSSVNGIVDPDRIAVGQALQIPSPTTIASASNPQQRPQKQHVILDGETLSDVAIAYGVDIASLARHNAIKNPDLVQPGQALSIP